MWCSGLDPKANNKGISEQTGEIQVKYLVYSVVETLVSQSANQEKHTQNSLYNLCSISVHLKVVLKVCKCWPWWCGYIYSMAPEAMNEFLK